MPDIPSRLAGIETRLPYMEAATAQADAKADRALVAVDSLAKEIRDERKSNKTVFWASVATVVTAAISGVTLLLTQGIK